MELDAQSPMAEPSAALAAPSSLLQLPHLLRSGSCDKTSQSPPYPQVPATLPPTPDSAPGSPMEVQVEPEPQPLVAEKDTICLAASCHEDSSTEMEEEKEHAPSTVAELGSEIASETSLPPLPSSMLALMGRAANFLQIPWKTPAELRRSVFRTQAVAPTTQLFPPFPDFMEEVRSSWDQPASAPSILKQAA
ncbi:UNVERIFIED_CONTAM: hypothetical protein FKN15_002994 [Acipenser sinensis]